MAVKLDDDSEFMIKNCTKEAEAIQLADQCTDLINNAENGVSGSDEESSDWDSE